MSKITPTDNQPTSDIPLSELLARVRSGDRDAAAILGMQYAPEIRRRVRSQLGTELRRIFDSTDIVSTMLRRLDEYIMRNRVRAESDREVRALLLRICNNAVTDKLRIIQRLKRVEGEDSPVAQMILRSLASEDTDLSDPDDSRLVQIFDLLNNDIDRKILWFWLAGHGLESISNFLDMPNTRVRKRWQLIRECLQDQIGGPDL